LRYEVIVKRSVIFVGFVVVAITAGLFSTKYLVKPAPMAPDFELKVLDGPRDTMSLSSLRGKAVLVNFWATWCEPCKAEMPWLVDLQNKYGPQGFQIIGVAQDDTDANTIVDFAHKMKLNYPILQGTNHTADLYPSEGLPLSIYVDRSGRIVYRAVGLIQESMMEDAIKKALAQGSATTASAK
jgi:thiol-disulfide isomerase/thioredoxin